MSLLFIEAKKQFSLALDCELYCKRSAHKLHIHDKYTCTSKQKHAKSSPWQSFMTFLLCNSSLNSSLFTDDEGSGEESEDCSEENIRYSCFEVFCI